MTVEMHRQTCQSCGSILVKNVLYREQGEPDKVFVVCKECEELVARYVIQPGGYYHHKKSFESYLRGVTRSGEFMSGKNLKSQFEKAQEDCLRRFQEVQEFLKKKEDS